ncbi:MAG: oxidoreductase [Dinoroseobacter sp.]|nr:oxidoreductase [Dinoroseobacter sp.]
MFRMLVAAIFVTSAALCVEANAQDTIPLEVELAGGQAIQLSLEDLDAMEQTEFTTTTIWTDGSNRFSGVSVLSLLQSVDAEGTTLQMSALNDYSVEMPLADLEDGAPILATRMDGETMSVREKGPYWIIYPFDRGARYQTESNFARSVWQLKQLKVLD